MHRSMKQGILLLFNMIIYGNNSCFFMGLYVRRSENKFHSCFCPVLKSAPSQKKNNVRCIIECCGLEIENGDNKCDVWRQQ